MAYLAVDFTVVATLINHRLSIPHFDSRALENGIDPVKKSLRRNHDDFVYYSEGKYEKYSGEYLK